MTVYADNAATTQMSDSVLKAMMPLLTDIYGNPSSLHSVGQIAKEHLEAARETVAECIGACSFPYRRATPPAPAPRSPCCRT